MHVWHTASCDEASVFFSDGISLQFFFVLFNRERQFFITGGESTRCLNTMNCERCRYYEGTLGENTSAANAFIPLNC